MARALITGPTSGIGVAFAREFAARGFGLVLVSRNADRLQMVANDLQAEFAVPCEVIVADLAERSALDVVEERLRRGDVNVLVNNAGFGLATSFRSTQVDDEQRLLDVMVTAVLRLTHAAIPGMVNRGNGMIINVSSVASWTTGGTYSAAKAWATVFTEGLVDQLSGTGIRVVAVCPGFVRTEFHDRAEMDVSRIPGFLWLTPQAVVRQAMRDLALQRPISVTGLQYKVLSAILRSTPREWIRKGSRLRNAVVSAREVPPALAPGRSATHGVEHPAK
jgi:short-subunit dehydrogenase